MDSSETASAWLGKQLFLWPLHPESGNFYASVCRVSLLLLCLGAGSRLEQLWEPAAGAMGHNGGCRGMVPEDDRAREQNSPHPGDPHGVVHLESAKRRHLQKQDQHAGAGLLTYQRGSPLLEIGWWEGPRNSLCRKQHYE